MTTFQPGLYRNSKKDQVELWRAAWVKQEWYHYERNLPSPLTSWGRPPDPIKNVYQRCRPNVKIKTKQNKTWRRLETSIQASDGPPQLTTNQQTTPCRQHAHGNTLLMQAVFILIFFFFNWIPMNYDIKALQLKLINDSFQRMKRAGTMESKLNELMSGSVSEWRKNKYIFTTLKTILNKRTSQREPEEAIQTLRSSTNVCQKINVCFRAEREGWAL